MDSTPRAYRLKASNACLSFFNIKRGNAAVLSRQLDVQADTLIAQVDTHQARFEAQREADERYEEDELVERWSEERADERKVREMFGSLHTDQE